MKTMILMAAIAAGFVITADDAQARGEREPIAFETLDANSDGEVTFAEMQAHRQAQGVARFAETDTNGDGALSSEELTAAASERQDERSARRVERMLERLDANDDGLIQQSEMAAMAAERGDDRAERGQEHFAEADTDGSGGLSAEEFEAAKEDRGGRHGGRDGRRGGN